MRLLILPSLTSGKADRASLHALQSRIVSGGDRTVGDLRYVWRGSQAEQLSLMQIPERLAAFGIRALGQHGVPR